MAIKNTVKALKKSELLKLEDLDLDQMNHLMQSYSNMILTYIALSQHYIKEDQRVIQSLRDVRNCSMNLDKLSKIYRKKSVDFSKQYRLNRKSKKVSND